MTQRCISAFALAMLAYSLTAQGPMGVNYGIASGDMDIGWDQSLAGELTSSDQSPMIMGHPQAGSEFHRDGFTFHGNQGTVTVIDLQCDFDGYLFLIDPQGNVAALNDDFTSLNTSQISHTLTMTGMHRVIVSSFSPGASGNYTLTLRGLPGVAQPDPSAQPAEVFDSQQRFGYETSEPIRQSQGVFQDMVQGESIVDRLRPAEQSRPQQPNFPVTNTQQDMQPGSPAEQSGQPQGNSPVSADDWFQQLARQAELNRLEAERSGELIRRLDEPTPDGTDPNTTGQSATQP